MSNDYTLEKLKISERLGTVETKFAVQEEKLKNLEPMIKDIHTAIMGNNGTKGITTRVALLEQDKSVRDKHLIVVYSSLIGLACKSLWDIITKKVF